MYITVVSTHDLTKAIYSNEACIIYNFIILQMNGSWEKCVCYKNTTLQYATF